MHTTGLVPSAFTRLVLVLWLVGSSLHLQAGAPVLSIQPRQEFGWHRIAGTADAAQVYTIMGSGNLSNWQAIATLHDRPGTNGANTSFRFLDPATDVFPQRFYRLATHPPTPTNDWKNQVYFPNDPFADSDVIPGNPHPIKFAIDFAEPFRVYYQNAARFPFHYDFAVERLERFRGMDNAEFDAVSLHTNAQQVLLGVVLLPPPGSYRQDIGIQFVGLDVYPAEKIRDWFRLVQSTIVETRPNTQILYMPTLEQTAAAEHARAYFASNGIQVSSPDIWVEGDAQIYAAGWAVGRLKFFRALDIRTAFNEGRLLPQDILLTDGVPAEIPLLAGLITLVPTTPNSHVALLARTYGIPFVYLANPAERTRVRGLADREVVFRARPNSFGNAVKILDVEGSLTPQFRAELLALKAPPAINLVPMATFGAISAPTTNLTPADTRYFGGKAANFGVLRRTLPTNSPEAIAFSFDLWNAFLDQTLPGGQTLRATINQRLSGYSYPPDLTTLRTNLIVVRDLIRQTAQFTASQRQGITNALARFDSRRNIRFRSSTNLEDTENYIGAGLYDSYSGCLADDLDGDNNGPSICDPTESSERGVFRAIQRVYASFYNDDAFIERLRLGVNEAHVGMAVLVHYSFPDTIEMANGVATLEVRPASSHRASLNTQVGAESVTNPDGSSLPEIVEITRYSFGTYPSLIQTSTRLTNGQYVLDWDSEYRQLMEMFVAVADAYSAQFPNKRLFQLDFEYKKVQPGVLEIKQVREVPPPPSINLPAPYLINEPVSFVVYQGECRSEAFDVHHLKSRLDIQTANTRLDRTNSSFLSNVTFEFLDGTNIVSTAGAITNWPGFSHETDYYGATDSWIYGTGTNARTFSLLIEGAKPGVVSSADAIRFISDYRPILSAAFARPLPTITSTGALAWMTNFTVCMTLARPVATNDPVESVGVTRGNRSIGGTFHAPFLPPNFIIKTTPLLAWIQGGISGFTSPAVPVYDYYALSFSPWHHNFFNDVIIEPGLEPSLSDVQRAELRAQNIKLLYGHAERFGPDGRLFILGFDGTVREVQ